MLQLLLRKHGANHTNRIATTFIESAGLIDSRDDCPQGSQITQWVGGGTGDGGTQPVLNATLALILSAQFDYAMEGARGKG